MKQSFNDLLNVINSQKYKQRLLLLFASVNESNKSRKKSEKKGTIEPVMVVDKLPSNLSTFSALIDEADVINKKWDFIFIASLNGDEKQPPSTEDAGPFLEQMSNDVLTGTNIGRYVVFDRNENPIEINAA